MPTVNSKMAFSACYSSRKHESAKQHQPCAIQMFRDVNSGEHHTSYGTQARTGWQHTHVFLSKACKGSFANISRLTMPDSGNGGTQLVKKTGSSHAHPFFKLLRPVLNVCISLILWYSLLLPNTFWENTSSTEPSQTSCQWHPISSVQVRGQGFKPRTPGPSAW